MHYLGALPDLPLPGTGRPPLRTRRQPLAQIILCQGCCCGHTERGLPEVPVTWLKEIWKKEKLNKYVQLTISGCLGPCDLPNVCCIQTPSEQVWYGRLSSREDYAVLLRWAQHCRAQGHVLPWPQELEHLRFERWRRSEEDGGPWTPLPQEPADLILWSAADTDLLCWSAARARLPDSFPSMRALSLDQLRDRRVFEAYLDDVLQEARVLLVRLLGGLSYWRAQLEAVHLLARTHDLALLVLPGEAQADPALSAWSTAPAETVAMACRYCTAGGVDNAEALLRFLSDRFLGTSFGYAPPRELPETGIYHPDSPEVLDVAAWRAHYCRPERPTAGVVFYRAHWLTGNLAPVDALVRALEEQGLNVLAAFGPDLGRVLTAGLLPADLDVLLTTTSFRSPAGVGDRLPDVPLLQVIFAGSSENVWAANPAGLTPRDLAMNVALPEFDGRIITTAVSFKQSSVYDAHLQTEVRRYQPRPDRVQQVARLAANWARLRRLPNAQKRIAILLANYPSKNARVGNAVGLDTPASLHRLLTALRQAGYDTGPSLPADGQALIEALIAASLQDREFASAAAVAQSPGWVSEDTYQAWLQELPESARTALCRQWGDLSQAPCYLPGGVPIPGLLLGNIFLGIQPARGYDQDPAAIYHSPDLPPPPFYLAFYYWLRRVFGAHAILHLGKHGNLEWLPGKSLALSAACFPEVILGDLPHIYPYIINNPGEGTQAKRRSAAVIVDHLIPPPTRAGVYGELAQLEQLLEEYYTVQGLDPAKAPLVLEQIGALLHRTELYRDLESPQPPAVEQLSQLLPRLDNYLCELKEAQIRDGLHILGQLPTGAQRQELLLALVRWDNGPVPGLPKALALDLGVDPAVFHGDHSRPACACLSQNAPLPSALTACRTTGEVAEHLTALAQRLLAAALEADPEQFRLDHPEEVLGVPGPLLQTRRTLDFLQHVVWPRLQLCSQEIDNILLALAGRFVPPGPSGAPTRGQADILPTGRNFYSQDVRALPTPTAWRVGWAAAEALLRRHRERTGNYPESVALVVWGTSNLRTGGDDIAEIFALLGVRPRWDEVNRRLLGVEPIPLAELGRPRIDVLVRISGLFRDAFPHLVRLLHEAVQLVARLEEPPDRNFIRAHLARDVALLRRTLSPTEAEQRACLRIFGSKPGAYGTGLLPLLDSRCWQTTADLAEVFLTWSGYAYTGNEEADGQPQRDALAFHLQHTEVVVQNQDNREHDLFDSDDYFQFHGGLIATVRALRGAAPAAYWGDTSRPDAVVVRTLQEEVYRVFRSRVVNPRWLAGVRRHGYKGAAEMAATVDYLFGYDATAQVVDDWMYQRLTEAYLFDDQMRVFLRQVNPWAERAMIERLLEAAERGLWEAPDPATLQHLQEQYLDNEACLEGGR